MSLGTDSALNKIPHPRLMQSLPRAFPAWVTVQEAIEVQGDDYAIEETWADVPHLRAMRGTLATVRQSAGDETQRADVTEVEATHTLSLPGYFPEITVTHRARVARAQGESGQLFDILSVTHDSQATQTRLELEEVSY